MFHHDRDQRPRLQQYAFCRRGRIESLALQHATGSHRFRAFPFHGGKAVRLWVDAERARFVRRPIIEMLNSANEWEAKPPLPESVSLGRLFVRENDSWVRALTLPRMLDGRGFGNLCKLPDQGIYGREIPLATMVGDDSLAPVKWLRKILVGRGSGRAVGLRAKNGGSAEPHPTNSRAMILKKRLGRCFPNHRRKNRGNRNAPRNDLARIDFSDVPMSAVVDSHGARCSTRRSAKDTAICRACPELQHDLNPSLQIPRPTRGDNWVSSPRMELRPGAARSSPSSSRRRSRHRGRARG